MNETTDIERYITNHRKCQHEAWEGNPEVDAYCKNCKMDEFEVSQEYTKLHNEAIRVLYIN